MGDAPTDAQQSPDYGVQDFGEDENFSLVGEAIIIGLR
jgi:hypothetical protein